MKLGVSNLAWGNIDYSILKQNNINYIEIILPKFIDWDNINLTKVKHFITNNTEHNINVLSTQSILFNSKVNSFHDVNFTTHIKKIIDICNEIKIDKLVLGAPSLRKGKLDVGLADNFHYINEILKESNKILLLEPNSKEYKGNYFYTIKEIANFITQNNFSNIKTMIDTHNILLENEDPSEMFRMYQPLIKHVHISEQNLQDFTYSNTHVELAKTLKELNYNDLVIYEAKPSINLKTSIELFNKTYNI